MNENNRNYGLPQPKSARKFCCEFSWLQDLVLVFLALVFHLAHFLITWIYCIRMCFKIEQYIKFVIEK